MDFFESLFCLLAGGSFVAAIVVAAMHFSRRAQMTHLERRVASIEDAVRELRSDRSAAAAPPRAASPEASVGRAPPAPVAAPHVPAAVPPPRAAAPIAAEEMPHATPRGAVPADTEGPPARRERSAADLEVFLGGRVLLVVGVVAVLIGLGFFFRYAVDRGWVNYGLRIAAGAVFGVFAIIGGEVFRRRGFSVFGQALMGGGIGALFLCDYFASVRYGFYDRPAAFAIAACITTAATVLAVLRDAPFLAWLGFAGAFLAPALLGRNEDAIEGLTGWLAVADLGVAATLVLRRWTGLDVLASVASVGYFLAWNDRHFRPSRLGVAAACLAAIVALVLVTSFVPAALARRRGSAASVGGAALALIVAIGVGVHRFFPEHRIAFGASIVGVACAVAAMALLHRARSEEGKPFAEALFALSLACVAAAVPVMLHTYAVAPAWAAIGAACVHAGARLGRRWLITAGYVGIVLAALQVLHLRSEVGDRVADPVFGLDFLAALAPCAAFAVAAWSVRRLEPDRAASLASVTAATWATCALLAHETWRTFGPTWAGGGSREAALLATTTLAAVATVAVSAAFRGRPGLGALPVLGPLVLLVGMAAATLVLPRPDDLTVVANRPFLTGSIAVLAFVAASLAGLRPVALPLTLAVLWLFLVGTNEVLAWGRTGPARGVAADEMGRRAQVALSVWWGLYGASLVAIGFWRRTAAFRWAGIALLFVTVAKVFLVDMSQLETVYRVGSFLGLGALLVAASFLYQRLRPR